MIPFAIFVGGVLLLGATAIAAQRGYRRCIWCHWLAPSVEVRRHHEHTAHAGRG